MTAHQRLTLRDTLEHTLGLRGEELDGVINANDREETRAALLDAARTLGEIVVRAQDVHTWLHASHVMLRGRTPLSYLLASQPQVVQNLARRADQGEFS